MQMHYSQWAVCGSGSFSLDESVPDGDGDCLSTTVHVELLQDMLDMVADGVGGDYEATGDVTGAEAFR